MVAVTTPHESIAPDLAARGRSLIEWAEQRMPALTQLKQSFRRERPLAGLRISGSLHLTSETGAFARCLQAGGATVTLSGSNPLSTRDEICASLTADDGMAVYARYGEDRETYYRHLRAAAAVRPHIVLDDGADLIAHLVDAQGEMPLVGIEQTTTGVQRLRALEGSGRLPFPVIALNDAPLKQEFDNPYGTGQNTFDGVLRATNILIAGKTVVVAGYGWAGRGVASRARGMGANVVVTEIAPVPALHAYYDGFRVLPMADALALADVVITATGCREVVGAEHFGRIKDGAILANSGHFDVEIDAEALAQAAAATVAIRPNLVEYRFPNGKRVYLLAQGRLVGQAAAEASPADVMDLTFTLMAVTIEWAVREGLTERRVILPPVEFTERVAAMKLAALGIEHDQLTRSQEEYVSSWAVGT